MKIILILITIIFLILHYNTCNYEGFNMAPIKRIYIDKTYVINLKKNKDRWDNILNLANNANLKITRFDAIYGKELDNDDYRIKKYFKMNILNKNQIGCALSHISIWEDAVKNDYDNIIIFEDDAIIPPEFNNRLNTILNQLPDNWDMVLLGITLGHGTVYSNNLLRPYKEHGNWGLMGYIINTKFIKSILPTLKLNKPIDNYLRDNYYYNENNNIFITNPLIINHDYSFYSDNFNRERKGEEYKNNIKIY